MKYVLVCRGFYMKRNGFVRKVSNNGTRAPKGFDAFRFSYRRHFTIQTLPLMVQNSAVLKHENVTLFVRHATNSITTI